MVMSLRTGSFVPIHSNAAVFTKTVYAVRQRSRVSSWLSAGGAAAQQLQQHGLQLLLEDQESRDTDHAGLNTLQTTQHVDLVK
jgi:hypothetical protein